MTTPTPRAARCPNCGSVVDGRSLVCGSCGAIIPLEIGSRRLRDSAALRLRELHLAPSGQALLTWILALIPLAIAPPVVAMLLLRRPAHAGVGEADRVWVAMVAVLNIILSIMFWRWFAETALGLGPGLLSFFSDALGRHVPPAAKSIPL